MFRAVLARNEDKPEPPLDNGMGEFTITKLMMLPIQVNYVMHCSAFVQMLKAIMNGDFDAKAQVSVPSGLKIYWLECKTSDHHSQPTS